VDERAVNVFLEAELRASVLFQVSKLAQVTNVWAKNALELPSWTAICPGVAVGLCQKVKSLEDTWQTELPGEGAIVFCQHASGEEEIPPRCRGLVVCRDLPVLSHLAVRARQMGVTFACTTELCLFNEQGQFAIGTVIRLEVTSGGGVQVVEADAKEAASLSNAGDQSKVGETKKVPQLGRLNFKETSVLTAAQLDRLKADTVGAKAAAAGRLEAIAVTVRSMQQGAFRTPASCAIPFGVMEQVVHGKEIEESLDLLEQALKHKAQIAERASQLREAIQKLKVDPAIISSVAQSFPSHVTHVAVRSSANSEDLDNVSGAGLHDSVLSVDLRLSSDLEKAILQVWASLFTLRAVQSRHSSSMPLYHGISMGVLVQEMATSAIQDENSYAFIMFSEHAATCDKTMVYIELCVGLGETLASANIPGTPYRITVQKDEPNDVQVITLGSFSHALVSSDGALEHRMIDYSTVKLSADRECLEKLARRLCSTAVRVEKEWGVGMDMEGVVVDREGTHDIFLVQARPIVKPVI